MLENSQFYLQKKFPPKNLTNYDALPYYNHSFKNLIFNILMKIFNATTNNAALGWSDGHSPHCPICLSFQEDIYLIECSF